MLLVAITKSLTTKKCCILSKFLLFLAFSYVFFRNADCLILFSYFSPACMFSLFTFSTWFLLFLFLLAASADLFIEELFEFILLFHNDLELIFYTFGNSERVSWIVFLSVTATLLARICFQFNSTWHYHQYHWQWTCCFISR